MADISQRYVAYKIIDVGYPPLELESFSSEGQAANYLSNKSRNFFVIDRETMLGITPMHNKSMRKYLNTKE